MLLSFFPPPISRKIKKMWEYFPEKGLTAMSKLIYKSKFRLYYNLLK
jgi:hypothetical protein